MGSQSVRGRGEWELSFSFLQGHPLQPVLPFGGRTPSLAPAPGLEAVGESSHSFLKAAVVLSANASCVVWQRSRRRPAWWWV